jgi:hypothetical protein
MSEPDPTDPYGPPEYSLADKLMHAAVGHVVDGDNEAALALAVELLGRAIDELELTPRQQQELHELTDGVDPENPLE